VASYEAGRASGDDEEEDDNQRDRLGPG